jgi:MEDS: MEthanogen/methylotroph, DcmR Sensory domain
MDNVNDFEEKDSLKGMGALITRTIHRERAPIRLKLSIIVGAISSQYHLPANSSSNIISPLGFCSTDVPPGTHICMFYENNDERHHVIVNFLHAGVKNSEKCMYACGDHSIPDVKDSLQENGLDVNEAVDRGALNIFRGEDFYGGGDFDPDKTIVKAGSTASQALDEGYPVLRFSGESNHTRKSDLHHEKVIEYEHKLNHHYFSKHPALAICLYNIRHFSDNFLDQIINAHPYFIYQGQFRQNPSFGTS